LVVVDVAVVAFVVAVVGFGAVGYVCACVVVAVVAVVAFVVAVVAVVVFVVAVVAFVVAVVAFDVVGGVPRPLVLGGGVGGTVYVTLHGVSHARNAMSVALYCVHSPNESMSAGGALDTG
jgi:hypothetical protein